MTMLYIPTILVTVLAMTRGRTMEQTPGWGRAMAEQGLGAREDEKTAGLGASEDNSNENQHALGLGAQEDDQTPGWGASEELDLRSFGVKALELAFREEGETVGFGDKQEEQSLGLEMLL